MNNTKCLLESKEKKRKISKFFQQIFYSYSLKKQSSKIIKYNANQDMLHLH